MIYISLQSCHAYVYLKLMCVLTTAGVTHFINCISKKCVEVRIYRQLKNIHSQTPVLFGGGGMNVCFDPVHNVI